MSEQSSHIQRTHKIMRPRVTPTEKFAEAKPDSTEELKQRALDELGHAVQYQLEAHGPTGVAAAHYRNTVQLAEIVIHAGEDTDAHILAAAALDGLADFEANGPLATGNDALHRNVEFLRANAKQHLERVAEITRDEDGKVPEDIATSIDVIAADLLAPEDPAKAHDLLVVAQQHMNGNTPTEVKRLLVEKEDDMQAHPAAEIVLAFHNQAGELQEAHAA
jgi:hypothetical protein